MRVELSLVAGLDAPLDPRGPPVAWCAADQAVAPRFTEPFAIDPGGLWFEGEVVPSFGVWNGIAAARRARLVAQFRLTRWRGASDFMLELLPEDDALRIAVARLAGVRTLGEAGLRITGALRQGNLLSWSWPGRGPKRERLGLRDCVRVPLVRAVGQSGAARLSIDLGTGGEEEPVPAAITEGRADAYRQKVLIDEPFFLWVGERRTLAAHVVARIARLTPGA